MSDPAAPELHYISYPAFLEAVEGLAQSLEDDPWRPDFLVGIGRGGLVPAVFLSHRTEIPMLSIDHSSGEPGFADELLGKLAAKTREQQNLLIVDDINDSGSTIVHLLAAVEARGGLAAHLRVAVLIDNRASRAGVDYRFQTIDRETDKRWFVFPWEAVARRDSLIDEALSVPERLG